MSFVIFFDGPHYDLCRVLRPVNSHKETSWRQKDLLEKFINFESFLRNICLPSLAQFNPVKPLIYWIRKGM